MSVAKSILTMTYPKTGKLPRRVRAIANTPKGGKLFSLVINCPSETKGLERNQYEVYKTIEEIHALAAWQLATQLAWLYGEDGDLIPAKIHRVGLVGQGEDVTMWTLKENVTAKEMLTSVEV
jgi:hypothetical protein